MQGRGSLAFAALLALSICGCSEDSGSTNPAPASSVPTAGTSEETVAAYLAAMKESDWKSCAALLHPEALIEFAHLMRPILHASRSEKTTTDLGFHSSDEIDVISPTDLFIRMMTLKTKLRPKLVEVYRSATWKILGKVQEGDVTHVVVRLETTSSRGTTASSVTVESLKPTGGEWRLLLSRELQGEAQGALSGSESNR